MIKKMMISKDSPSNPKNNQKIKNIAFAQKKYQKKLDLYSNK